ncbi:hypothetical protein MAIT1_00925 [Magnetofaba australis IT-1]|uniref:HEAT repeat domain-containing protein n=2 Tax=Magnetofaba TaxID=1472292 RepID=A0A1Y2K258_9PROT|nr:hypothetical protein MAIT1_00925 [Magnetofaba australis IT-1]
MGSAASLSQLSASLTQSPDFRVRTQAALALGSSGNKQAVNILCTGLNDSNTTVRTAVAASLGRLNQGGQECLNQRAQSETNAGVKRAIQQALAKMGSGQGGSSLSSVRYLFFVNGVRNRSSVDAGKVTQHIFAYLKQGLTKSDTLVVSAGAVNQYAALLQQSPATRAYYLSPAFSNEFLNGVLKAKLDVSIMKYPQQNIVGSLTKKTSMNSGSATEQNILRLLGAASNAMASAITQSAPRLP